MLSLLEKLPTALQERSQTPPEPGKGRAALHCQAAGLGLGLRMCAGQRSQRQRSKEEAGRGWGHGSLKCGDPQTAARHMWEVGCSLVDGGGSETYLRTTGHRKQQKARPDQTGSALDCGQCPEPLWGFSIRMD